MIVVSRVVYKVNRKIKEYYLYESRNEGTIEYQKKRLKKINYGNHYDKEENWNKNDAQYLIEKER